MDESMQCDVCGKVDMTTMAQAGRKLVYGTPVWPDESRPGGTAPMSAAERKEALQGCPFHIQEPLLLPNENKKHETL